jgi:hypothetical protein
MGAVLWSRLILLLLLLAVLLLVVFVPWRRLSGNDAEMVERARLIGEAVNAYHRDTVEWPERLRDAEGFLAAGKDWPVNPYNGQPIEDTGSREFDPATSVGMVFYEKFYRDEQLMNYQLHVFGDRGKLHIFSNTAFGLKE